MDRVRILHDKVRDRDDVGVKICDSSGIIYLTSDSHISEQYYQEKENFNYWKTNSWEDSLNETKTDDIRRKEQFHELVAGKNCLDFGSGNGGFLKSISSFAKNVAGIEIQQDVVKLLKSKSYDVRNSITEFDSNQFDAITMFHVLEHLQNPIETLENIRNYLNDKGKIIVEVPHANDFLLKMAESKKFMEFTFWSEHLILHTKESLTAFLRKAGYHNIKIIFTQRYSIANHLHWLAKDQPGGHEKWSLFNKNNLVKAYNNTLKELSLTDTIIAIADK